MIRRLYLHGGDHITGLASCGGPFSFEAACPADMVQALAAQHPRFQQMMVRGRYHLVAGPLSRPISLSGPSLYAPCRARTYHLYPAIAGAVKGRGKLVLGLTLLGLSFVPGVSASLGQFGTSATGSAQFGASFASIGNQLLARTGQYLMAQGALKSISPPRFAQTDHQPASLAALASSQQEGLTIPLIYGEVRVEAPLFIETGLHIETISLS